MEVKIKNIKDNIYKELQIEANKKGLSVSDVINMVLEQHLQTKKMEKKNRVKKLHAILDKGIDMHVSVEVARKIIKDKEDIYD
ncbi:MAG: hypothetical protein ACE5KT_10870 [Methanosarcinales archaeon]